MQSFFFLGKKSLPTMNSQEAKTFALISAYETQKEKLERRIDELLESKVEEKEKEDLNRSEKSKFLFEQLTERVNELNSDKARLESETYVLNEKLNRTLIENDKLNERIKELQMLYEKLRNENLSFYEKLKRNNYSTHHSKNVNVSFEEDKENKMSLANKIKTEPSVRNEIPANKTRDPGDEIIMVKLKI